MVNPPENTVDLIITLGLFTWEGLKEAGARIASGVKPWDTKVFVSGMGNLLFQLVALALLGLVFVDGYGRHLQRNNFLVIALFILYVISCIK